MTYPVHIATAAGVKQPVSTCGINADRDTGLKRLRMDALHPRASPTVYHLLMMVV
jgi:hypothetical protein